MNLLQKNDLESIGIRYDFGKKSILNLPISRKGLKITTRCAECGKTLHVQKTRKRRVKTLSGEKQLEFSLKYCKTHVLSTEQISIINPICPKNRTFDSKVMIEYKKFDDIIVPSKANVSWKLSTGDFCYDKVEVVDIKFNNPSMY